MSETPVESEHIELGSFLDGLTTHHTEQATRLRERDPNSVTFREMAEAHERDALLLKGLKPSLDRGESAQLPENTTISDVLGTFATERYLPAMMALSSNDNPQAPGGLTLTWKKEIGPSISERDDKTTGFEMRFSNGVALTANLKEPIPTIRSTVATPDSIMFLRTAKIGSVALSHTTKLSSNSLI